MAKIYVENIWVEDLFKWFYDHVRDSGGDGCGVIICKNYKEASDWFIEWFKKEYKKEDFWHPKREYDNRINFHDDNENFIFTDEEVESVFGEYIFVVTKECSFGYEPTECDKIIQSI